MWTALALAAYLMLSGADIGQSMSCVGARTCYEANPVLRPLATHPAWYGATKIGISVGMVGLVQKVTKPKSKQRLVAYIGMAAVQAVVVGLNARRTRGK